MWTAVYDWTRATNMIKKNWCLKSAYINRWYINNMWSKLTTGNSYDPPIAFRKWPNVIQSKHLSIFVWCNQKRKTLVILLIYFTLFFTSTKLLLKMRITSCSLWWTQHLNELLVYFTLIKHQHSIPLYFCIQCFKVSGGFSKVYLYLRCTKVGTSNFFGLPSKSKNNSTLYLKSTVRVNKLAAHTKWDPKCYFQNSIWHLIIEIPLRWL